MYFGRPLFKSWLKASDGGRGGGGGVNGVQWSERGANVCLFLLSVLRFPFFKQSEENAFFLQIFFKVRKQAPVFIAESKTQERNEQSYHAKDFQPPNVLQSGYWAQTPPHPPSKEKHLHDSCRVY